MSNITPENPVDALLVLGRGIDESGVLSETSRLRAEMAVEIAQQLLPRVVVFSGGHSWVQELGGFEVPSEGAAMLDVARARYDQLGLTGIELAAEVTSMSTVENMVNSRPQLGLRDGDRLGVLTDGLHDSRGRVSYLAKLVFSKQQIQVFDIVPNEPNPGAGSEERLATIMTKAAMLAVTPGNDAAIMRRQRLLERANATYRTSSSLLANCGVLQERTIAH